VHVARFDGAFVHYFAWDVAQAEVDTAPFGLLHDRVI
jgi:hypothetical protein